MKPIKILPFMLIAITGLVAACSTSKLAQKADTDDVYNTTAKAKEYEAPVYQVNNQTNYNDDEYYGTSNPYYDMDYTSRINRFNGSYGYRNYYDPYYDFNGFNGLYSNNYLGFGMGYYNGYGMGYNPFYGNIWSNPFYGSMYGYGNYPFNGFGWGPYSMYDRYGYGGGYFGGGFYGGGGGYVNVGRTPNRARPGSNDTGVPRNGNNTAPNYGRPTRSSTANNGSAGNYNGRPTRTQSSTPNTQSAPTYERPTRSSNPSPSYTPSQSSGGSSGGGGSTGGGGRGGSPTRAGRG